MVVCEPLGLFAVGIEDRMPGAAVDAPCEGLNQVEYQYVPLLEYVFYTPTRIYTSTYYAHTSSNRRSTTSQTILFKHVINNFFLPVLKPRRPFKGIGPVTPPGRNRLGTARRARPHTFGALKENAVMTCTARLIYEEFTSNIKTFVYQPVIIHSERSHTRCPQKRNRRRPFRQRQHHALCTSHAGPCSLPGPFALQTAPACVKGPYKENHTGAFQKRPNGHPPTGPPLS